MRVSTTIALAASLAASAVSAQGKMGFSLGTKLADGSCKSQKDYENDFDAIKQASGSNIVRGYSASDCNNAENIMPAAKAKGAQVVLAIWPDVQESYDADTAAIKKVYSEYTDQLYAVTVGSETLYRGNFTGEELMSKISDVKKMFPKTKVGTADSWNKYADGTADALLTGQTKPDILLVNAFGFWQGQDIKNASHQYFDDLMQAFQHIQDKAGSTDAIELWNGETGWPSDGGTDYQAAKAGTENAKSYYQAGFCAAITWGINAFYFEAFDEPWKPTSVGDNGEDADETHWGAMKADRTKKFDMQC